MKIARIVFQQADPPERKRMVLVLDMEDQMSLSSLAVPDIAAKMQTALPGIFPDGSEATSHTCGGLDQGNPAHPFREELRRGVDIPHLFEHVLLHLLSRRTQICAGFCGQRSSDIERGITNLCYVVVDCPSELEAIVAVSITFQLVSAWIDGRSVTIDSSAVYKNFHDTIGWMLPGKVTQPFDHRPI